jgi:protein-tyrosine kinase
VNLEAKSDAGVLGLLDPDSPVRRHYEELAGNLLSMGGTGSVVVTSPEPDTGRTSICLGLGAALAGMGRRAAVVDCNLENAKLHRRTELRRAYQRSRRKQFPGTLWV